MLAAAGEPEGSLVCSGCALCAMSPEIVVGPLTSRLDPPILAAVPARLSAVGEAQSLLQRHVMSSKGLQSTLHIMAPLSI